MGSSLKFSIDGDASKFDATMRRVDAIAARTATKTLSMDRVLGQSMLNDEKSRLADVDQAHRNIMARRLWRKRAEERQERQIEEARQYAAGMRMEEQERRRFRLGAGGMELLHSGRATLDSLASGANPFTVAAQQLPQIFQAFVLMGKDGFAGLKDALANGLAKVGSGVERGAFRTFGAGAAKAGAEGVGIAAGGAAGGATATGLRALAARAGAGVLGVIGMGATAMAVTAAYLRGTAAVESDAQKMFLDTVENQREKLLNLGKQAAEAGKFTRENYLSFQMLANNGTLEGLAKARQMLPKYFTPEQKAARDEVTDYLQQLAIDAEKDPAQRGRMRASLDLAKAMRDVPELSKRSGIKEETVREAIKARYDAEIAQISDEKNRPSITGGKSVAALSSLERVGGALGGNIEFTNIGRSQLVELKKLVQLAERGRGVQF